MSRQSVVFFSLCTDCRKLHSSRSKHAKSTAKEEKRAFRFPERLPSHCASKKRHKILHFLCSVLFIQTSFVDLFVTRDCFLYRVSFRHLSSGRHFERKTYLSVTCTLHLLSDVWKPQPASWKVSDLKSIRCVDFLSQSLVLLALSHWTRVLQTWEFATLKFTRNLVCSNGWGGISRDYRSLWHSLSSKTTASKFVSLTFQFGLSGKGFPPFDKILKKNLVLFSNRRIRVYSVCLFSTSASSTWKNQQNSIMKGAITSQGKSWNVIDTKVRAVSPSHVLFGVNLT